MMTAEQKSPFTLRMYKETDFSMIQRWWGVHNEKIINANVLSDTGVIFEKNGEALAAGWAYMSNAKIAQIGWVVSNPKSKPKERVLAVYEVLDALEKFLKDAGYELVQMISDHSGLTKMAVSSGFKLIKPHDVVVKEL